MIIRAVPCQRKAASAFPPSAVLTALPRRIRLFLQLSYVLLESGRPNARVVLSKEEAMGLALRTVHRFSRKG